ncbi:uncharacterized protein LY79DRAFT_384732 [Colletotrichum navitas]|uniref:Uncharacterized protein n=1 Tax=Colletotrichum navitas TaxID=681940 RepID=A0AAD8Q7S3_9PEZI|nr:uncharacterized protein LY79DRAFT_384732 [Colletotrichum navitas]KAK1597397.1 hypothetical protein LY79DRAFT_384732 [Colletotrichum navitas]
MRTRCVLSLQCWRSISRCVVCESGVYMPAKQTREENNLDTSLQWDVNWLYDSNFCVNSSDLSTNHHTLAIVYASDSHCWWLCLCLVCPYFQLLAAEFLVLRTGWTLTQQHLMADNFRTLAERLEYNQTIPSRLQL